jgi:hypothetical protein
VVDVPFGDTTSLPELLGFAEGRRTLCYRDSRGRLFFGAMSSYSESDQDWGTRVSFSVSRVDYAEAVA